MLEKEKQTSQDATLADESSVKKQNKNPQALENNQTVMETTTKEQTFIANQRAKKDVDFAEGGLFANRYRIIKTLGEGAMGKVFEVEDTQNGKKVALKVIKKEGVDDETVKRFFREADLLNKLNHKNIVNVYGCGQYQEKPYFTMDIVEGVTLKTFLAQNKSDFKKRITMFIPILEALNNAHENNVIHRDLKPANIMISNNGTPIVMDFGIARKDDEESTKLTRTGMVLGTPMYMAPEQVNGERVTPKTDIYALGVILYEIITLQPPFSGNLSTLMWKIGHQDPIHPCQIDKDVPKDLANICLKAMAKNPSNRYATAAEMANDIKRYITGKKIKIKVQNNQKLLKWCKQNRSILASGFILIIALIIVFGSSKSNNADNTNNLKVSDNNSINNAFLVDNDAQNNQQNTENTLTETSQKIQTDNNLEIENTDSENNNHRKNKGHLTQKNMLKNNKGRRHHKKNSEKYSEKYEDGENTYEEEYEDDENTHEEEYEDDEYTYEEEYEDNEFPIPIKALPNPQDVKIVLDHVIEDGCKECSMLLQKRIQNIFSLEKEEIFSQIATNTPHDIVAKILEHAQKTNSKNVDENTKKMTASEIRRRRKFLSDHFRHCESCEKKVRQEKITSTHGKHSTVNWVKASEELLLLMWEHAHPSQQKEPPFPPFPPFPPRKKK